MSKGVESVSVTALPAAAVMAELSEVQLAIVLAMLVLGAGDVGIGVVGGVVSWGGAYVSGAALHRILRKAPPTKAPNGAFLLKPKWCLCGSS
jgi:hypothetical protein